ncbi:rhomboid family intramembrane serine protease [Vagococcus zengguangii]|uniref:Rhomboid family intramembrane serine protease n=2 Tax=Vagococcus zengguangii TaxID=2571750 RepID=A0A4D7CV64_9ENTE|nr:rhomboid family intramembrane serine protease [Vagococcus zengguangii]TLG80329.1 rhomboid family intramembrane serine protease [Vagococcus zengguangii]
MNWQRIKNDSWVTMLFLATQIIVFVVMTLVGLTRGMGISGTQDVGLLYEFGALNAHGIILYHEFWRFITPIFIHIGLTHLLFNSVFLYFAGRDLEAIMGHWRFFCFYLLAGIGGNIFSFAFANPASISAGASTALFGIFGAFIALGRIFPHNPKIQYMAKNMLTLAGINLLFNIFASNIDMLGHVGGLISGLLLGFVFSAPQLLSQRFSAMRDDNIHRRIACGLGFVLMLVALIMYSLQKYGMYL